MSALGLLKGPQHGQSRVIFPPTGHASSWSAAEAAGNALIALDVCSTDCPKQKVDMFISPPEVTTGRWFKRAHAVGYEYVKRVAASCNYWLYRQCTK